jgi:hypothetical protein
MKSEDNNMTPRKYAEGGTVGTDIADIYQNTLGRAPDAEGLATYQGMLDSGQSIDSIRSNIQGSQEAQDYQKNQAGLAAKAMASGALTDPGSLVDQATIQNISTDPNQLVSQPAPVIAQSAPVQQATFVDAKAATVQAEELAKAQSSVFTPAKTVEADITEAKVNSIMDGTEAATAQASSKATVRGQLAMLMDDFEGGEATPVWASGSMRKAMQVM